MSDIIRSILVVCIVSPAIAMCIANILCWKEVFSHVLFIILMLPGFLISLKRITRR